MKSCRIVVVLSVIFCQLAPVYAKSVKPVKELPYTKEQLMDSGIRTTYQGDRLDLISFPLGGIGTGCIGLSGTGKLIDWEIFNYPNKGFQPRFSFLSIWAKAEGSEPVFKVLEGQLNERLDGPMYLTGTMNWQGNGVGPQQTQAAGLPRMRRCRFQGKFPFAQVHLSDKKLPVDVVIEGWSPFIPGNARDSSLPAAILNISIRNNTNKTVETVLAANVKNCAGKYNQIIREPGFSALYMHDGVEDGNSMILATPATVSTWQQNWKGGEGWKSNFTCLQHFATTFASIGRFDSTGSPVEQEDSSDKAKMEKLAPTEDENSKVGSLGVPVKLKPGRKKTIPFIIAWYFPTIAVPPSWSGDPTSRWKNYYATQWDSGLEVARYIVDNFDGLQGDTRLFQKTFFSSTLPGVVLEAVSSQLSILRTPVLTRYPDGTLYGWEGTSVHGWADRRSNRRYGFGTCNHVYNYQQAIAYLFCDLQRSMLENFFFNGLKESNGAVAHRMLAGPDAKIDQKGSVETAADGQLGQVCQVCREWQLCGDDDWLKKIWPKAKKALEFAWKAWDKDKDGLLEGPHHNTLDLNFNTPETMCGSLYQAALLAGERMALYVGDQNSAKQYRRVFESGKKLSDEKLFNGEYYHQMLPAHGKYQLGSGCISEQLHGQIYARMLGLEDIYSRENIHKALASLFRYNYMESFYDRINTNRVYSVGDEGGLLIATWPKGNRPEYPLLYCDETQNGYEYQAAVNMLYEGYILEGLTVIKSIRDRYDGEKRNPYCEFEWGNHYVRSMANYGSLLALSGFRYSAVEKMLRCQPKINENNFKVFFSVDSGWGLISQKKNSGKTLVKVDIKKGKLKVKKLHLNVEQPVKKAEVKSHKQINAHIKKTTGEYWDSESLITVLFDDTIVIEPDRPLIVKIEF